MPTDPNFESRDERYTEYYRVHAYNDMIANLAKTSVLVWRGNVIGFISIAMSYMKPHRIPEYNDKGYGNIPSLLVSHLATRKDFENKGVATKLLSWAIQKATLYSKTIGCRFVMLNPKDDKKIRQFYANRNFSYVPRENGECDAFLFDISRQHYQDR